MHSWRLAATSRRCPYEQPRWDGTRHAARRADDPDQPPGATFSLVLRSGAWGVGYGIETVRLLLACGFKDLGRHRVWGARSPLNTESARTITRAGLVEASRIPERILRNGQWRDSLGRTGDLRSRVVCEFSVKACVPDAAVWAVRVRRTMVSRRVS
ncbi:GNAT family N-acetyltransferase [Streptomyces sp. NPDC059460]|uniref:GNAT family N-acetyltransferase n=1 Tax=Streptomyces sp. NPDC059460 TaxID=3346840 RepID=UPI0036A81D94